MIKLTKKTLIQGNGMHQHTLYGNFEFDESEFSKLNVTKDSILKHETPNGSFSNEHEPLQVEKGKWVMGKQVEYNPFNKTISMIWD